MALRDPWQTLDNARPRCPVCRGLLPLVFEGRLVMSVRALSVFLPSDLRTPTDAPGSPGYHLTHLHRACKRVLEIRTEDPSLATLIRRAA